MFNPWPYAEKEDRLIQVAKFLSANVLTTTIPDSLYKLDNLEYVSLDEGLSVSFFMTPIKTPEGIFYNWNGTKEVEKSAKEMK